MGLKNYLKRQVSEREYQMFISPLNIIETDRAILIKMPTRFTKEIILKHYGKEIRKYRKLSNKMLKIIVEDKEDREKITINEYRIAIRKIWLPAMGRKKLKTFEYLKIEELYKNKIPLKDVLNGIKQCLKEGKKSGRTIYSLGFCLPYIKQRGKK